MYPGNSESIIVCQEVYQINQVLSKSVSTYLICSELRPWLIDWYPLSTFPCSDQKRGTTIMYPVQ